MSPNSDLSSVPLLEVSNLTKRFVSKGFLTARRQVLAADRVCFRVDRGEAVALVGESGSGKTTIARIIARLERADEGKILLDGKDVLALEPRRASLEYRSKVQMIFQDPFGSLNPVHTVAHHIEVPLLRHRKATKPNVRQACLRLLGSVGLQPAEEFIDRNPEELSGGQKQRVAIARAIAVDPELLIADEPTSMLDVSIRMSILNLLKRLIQERNLGILLITHDLASARYLAKRILVLFRGTIVEEGESCKLIEKPAHPYTCALLSAIGAIDKDQSLPRQRVELCQDTHRGCPFASRCPQAWQVCWEVEPPVVDLGDRKVRCHLYAGVSQREAYR